MMVLYRGQTCEVMHHYCLKRNISEEKNKHNFMVTFVPQIYPISKNFLFFSYTFPTVGTGNFVLQNIL